ncbi:TonB-dependent receptor domain-containing protein [Sphingopyxis sp.]|jgi:iron complex outermembrane receptor protein|uniref:TonB-dependent receptor domain-containing protein n=1 Tax=Sphingopyxis sp. TaxID=1908224 RepID=UPI002DED4001|nr:TonB-dependent receptor [Sphingopyxis sp.]
MAFSYRSRLYVTASAAVWVLSGAPAWAQSTSATNEPDGAAQPAASEEQAPEGDIVVTGTLIRGVAPTGTNVVNLTSEDVVASGATSTNQLLARIPQITSAFNQTPTIQGGSGLQINRPNIRNLGAAGGSTTLILIDGHRAVPAGVLQTTPDPDVIPPGMLERVEVVPDGGSAIYGSDAIGGVINLITKKRFDGVEVTGRAGFADNYQTYDANVTAGKDWGSGSAFVSYAFSAHDAIFGRDRDYVRQTSPNAGFCPPGTVSVTRAGVTTTYALPGRTPGTITICDSTDNLSIYPKERRHSVFAGLTQDLSSWLSFDIRGFYTQRKLTNYIDLSASIASGGQTGTITSGNPFYVPIAPNDPGTQTVAFSYAGLQDNRAPNKLDEFQITPSFTAKLGGDWQLRALGSFGVSILDATSPAINAGAQGAALAGTTTATALNPYNLGATNPAVLASIFEQNRSHGKQELFNARTVVDGTLVNLPGGNVRLAVGAEIFEETFDAFNGQVPDNNYRSAPRSRNDRTVKSVFGEIVVPIVGADNSFAAVHSLRLSASARYDDYSDFGDTFNPKFGITYEPVDWIAVRGNWGKAFNAPSLADTSSSDNVVFFVPVSPWLDPADGAANFFRPTLVLAGGNSNLGPQKATTWSIGADVSPPVVPGLTLSATYYNIAITDQIALIPFTSPGVYAAPYAPFVVKDPTLAYVQSVAAGFPVLGGTTLEAAFAGLPPYVLLDARRNNLGEVEQDGIDFLASYNSTTSFGDVFGSIGGSYILNRRISPVAGGAFSNALKTPGASRLSLVATAGARVGKLSGSVTASHSGGYDINPTIVNPLFGTQTHVKSFTTVDLFFEYDLADTGILKDASLTLNVSNLFDTDPPVYYADNGYTNGGTFGRLVQIGIRKRF